MLMDLAEILISISIMEGTIEASYRKVLVNTKEGLFPMKEDLDLGQLMSKENHYIILAMVQGEIATLCTIIFYYSSN